MKKKPASIIPEVQPIEDNDDWWILRHQAKLNEVQRRRGNIDLLMIGDSITQGWEDEPSVCALWDKYYASRRAVNLGFSGDRTEQVLWRLQNGEVEGLDPKLTVLLIGTNNTGHRQDPAQDTALGVKVILEELRARLPITPILLLAIFPRSESPNDKLRLLNDEISRTIANFSDGRTIHFLDIGHNFVDTDGQLHTHLMPDLLHLSPDGYRVWAESMDPVLTELIR